MEVLTVGRAAGGSEASDAPLAHGGRGASGRRAVGVLPEQVLQGHSHAGAPSSPPTAHSGSIYDPFSRHELALAY